MKKNLMISALCLVLVVFINHIASAGSNTLLLTGGVQGSIPWSGFEYEYKTGHFGIGADIEGSYGSSAFLAGARAHLITRGYFAPESSNINGFVGMNLGSEVFIGYNPGEYLFTFDPSLTLGIDLRYKSLVGRLEAGYNPVYFFYNSTWVNSLIIKLGFGLSF